ncbi:TRAP transporter small permease subunit [Alkalihalobacillus sp. BA299]|uniref:TRAP transporter small permease subunit n=1 Tax=Alkalihalobacillus sp. BA299 TaxID=2815938 RepID=UPI001ADC680F|nr:TRAP transporter small permease subunit [Alkalihalobacillus sp. BA299]
MENFKKICAGIELLNEKVAKFSAWTILILILVVTYEVISRYVFNQPTKWSYEMSYFISSFFIIMAMALTLKTKNHVNIDIFYNKFSRRKKLLLSIFFNLVFFFPFWFLLLYTMIPNILNSFQTGERSSYGSWLPLIWPFKTWIFIGLTLLFIQGVLEFLKDIVRLIKGDEAI